jgi:hypothetical protein
MTSARNTTTSTPSARAGSDGDRANREDDVVFYERTEARRSTSTSELYIYIIGVVAVLIFAYMSGGDSLSREDGWWFATVMSVGYFVSRGLAKAGSSEPRLRRRNLDSA